MSADASASTPIEDDQTTAHATRPDRDAIFAALGREVFDLLVVGGGITGAGVARDAALRGLRVALVEKHDYASGTSSRSSRLVHGGVRYLEHGQIGLVFESSRERRTLQRIAPHLVRPLRVHLAGLSRRARAAMEAGRGTDAVRRALALSQPATRASRPGGVHRASPPCAPRRWSAARSTGTPRRTTCDSRSPPCSPPSTPAP